MSDQPEQDVVRFGGAGDLMMRELLPALHRLHGDAMLVTDVSVIGTAREPIGITLADDRRVPADHPDGNERSVHSVIQQDQLPCRVYWTL